MDARQKDIAQETFKVETIFCSGREGKKGCICYCLLEGQVTDNPSG